MIDIRCLFKLIPLALDRLEKACYTLITSPLLTIPSLQANPGLTMIWKSKIHSTDHDLAASTDHTFLIMVKSVWIQTKWFISAGAYEGFCSMKRLGILLLLLSPTGWDLVYRRITPSIKFGGTHLYTWVERATVRVKWLYLAQEHNAMSRARARTRTARSGVLTKRPPRLPFIEGVSSLFIYLFFCYQYFWFNVLVIQIPVKVMVPPPMRSYFHFETKKVWDHLRATWRYHHMQFTGPQVKVQHLVKGMTSALITMPRVAPLTPTPTLANLTLFQVKYKTRAQFWLGLTDSHLMRWRCFISIDCTQVFNAPKALYRQAAQNLLLSRS